MKLNKEEEKKKISKIIETYKREAQPRRVYFMDIINNIEKPLARLTRRK